MSDNRAELYHQVKKLNEYIEATLYENEFTESKAKKALPLVYKVWSILNRRKI